MWSSAPRTAARAAREAQETDAIYATLTPECYWSRAVRRPDPGAKDGRNFGHRRVFNGQPRAPHSRRRPARRTSARRSTPSNRGRVVLAKDLFYSGNAVIHRSRTRGRTTTYLHLSKIEVAPGEIVERGQRLGLVGRHGSRDRAALALGRADPRRARRSVLAVAARAVGGPSPGGGRKASGQLLPSRRQFLLA